MLRLLLLLLVLIYFGVVCAGLAWFFDWGTDPQRSMLWVGVFIPLLLLAVMSTMLLGWWALQVSS